MFFTVAVALTILTFICWALEIQRQKFIKWKQTAVENRNKLHDWYDGGALVTLSCEVKSKKESLTAVFVPDLRGRM